MPIIDQLFPWPWRVAPTMREGERGHRLEDANGQTIASYFGPASSGKAEAIMELGAQRQNLQRAEDHANPSRVQKVRANGKH